MLLRTDAHVLRGQNHGLFLDMARGRRWVRDFAEARLADRYGLKVLNLFAQAPSRNWASGPARWQSRTRSS